MRQKGSITIFFSLILSIILSLAGALLFSSKIAAGRAQTAMAMDMAMYSAMAKYDADLLEMYHVFFIDAGFGTQTLKLGKVLDEVESDLSYLLEPSKGKYSWGSTDFLELSLESSSITGYTLATDQNGGIFREQIIQYMEDTMVLQGISALKDRLSEQSDIFQDQKDELAVLEKMTDGFSIENIQDTESKSEIENSDENKENQIPVLTKEEQIKIEDTKEILKQVDKIKSTSILNLLVENQDSLSTWNMGEESPVSKRECQKGMGLAESLVESDTLMSKYLFQEYILGNINSYGAVCHDTGPMYGVEYILYGQNSDVKNLEKMVERLLLLREASNTAYLYSDTEKRETANAIALLITSAVALPELAPIVEAAIILAWAYVESLVDVCGLLSGKSVPYVKNSNSWQVGFENLLPALMDCRNYCKSSGNSYYKDYLTLMLYTKSENTKTMRCMDVMEMSIREIPGKEDFSMDCAVDTLEIEITVLAESKKMLQTVHRQCYRDM